MKKLLERVRANEVLVCDGAMGTLLQEKGLQAGECPELWCLERPDDVRDVHRSYREAGSDIVECNSFGGSRYKLKHFGLEERAAEINRAAAALAREVAGEAQYVMGSVGPTGTFMAPLGTESEEDFYAAFKEQFLALEEGGADAVVIETMTGLEEALVALRAAKENTKLTTVVSFTFDPQVQGGYATMMGVHPGPFAVAATEAGADMIGTNCGTGPDDMVEIVRLLREAVAEVPILAMPNAGMPQIVDGETVFRETPEEMAPKIQGIRNAGASIVGGCCGTTPAHIAAMKKALSS
jgi:5-methyltetrahydrofolate--homocysteine methyltransferase